MICAPATLTAWLDIIRGEFVEMPGLVLTRSQFQRLWGLDAQTCDEVITALVTARFLVPRGDDNYGRPGFV